MGYITANYISFLFDTLSVFFLAVIAIVSLPSALYATSYMKGLYAQDRIIFCWILLIAFIVSMALVVTAANALLFIIAWELMSLLSYFLVTFDREHDRSIQAGTIYIVMTHVGTAFIISSIMLMFKYAGSFDFAVIKTSCATMPSAIKNLIFIMLLIGFGTKAGIVPLHVWLPYAHPQAPSHVSSLMSGVMIKTAIYGMIRFIIMILGVNSIWWGNAILVIAAASCLVGVIYALMEPDIKKLLAYCSVENIGIILLGIGASMVFMKMGLPVLAVLAMVAGLYHLINHALFKGLLFLCAGSVYKATGKRDMEKLGGLIKVMPWTAGAFLVGAMAISALPPLNGFVSEWLTFQTFFYGAMNSPVNMRIFMCALAGVFALTGGLAAACFVKAFGVTFLAMPRSKYAADAKEVPILMRAAMVFMSALAIVFGLAASIIVTALTRISGSALGIDITGMRFTLNGFTVSPSQSSGVFLSTPLAGAAFFSIVALTVMALYFILGKGRYSVNGTWGCGYYALTPRTEYTATAFSKPFRIAFDFFLLPYRKTEKIRESFYHIKSFKYEVYTTPILRKYIYEPALKIIFKTANSMKRMQPGSIHLYISYIFITILFLIIFMNRF